MAASPWPFTNLLPNPIRLRSIPNKPDTKRNAHQRDGDRAEEYQVLRYDHALNETSVYGFFNKIYTIC